MKTLPLLLLASDDGWRVIPCDTSAQSHSGQHPDTLLGPLKEDPQAIVDAIRAAHSAASTHAKPAITIALPAHWCYAAPVSTEGLPPRQRQQAIAYRFEPLVPFPIEQLVVDTCGSGDSRLVVAAKCATLEPVVRALEDEVILVTSITPLVLLAAQAHKHSCEKNIAKPSPGDTDRNTIRFAEDLNIRGDAAAGVSELICDGDELTSWNWKPVPPQEAEDGAANRLNPRQTIVLACAASRVIASGQGRPWVNLQRGPLASRQMLQQVYRPLVSCAIAAALLLLVSILGLQARAWQYREAAQAYDDQARALYAEAFPQEQVPVSMERRLKTRLKQLEGRQGLAATDTPLFADQHTLMVVHDLLERLPDERRLVVTDLRITDGRVDLLGHARSHSDADAIAASLRADKRFEVTPPSTENLPGQGVQFALNLTYLPPENQLQGETGDPDGSLAADPNTSELDDTSTANPVSLNDRGTP